MQKATVKKTNQWLLPLVLILFLLQVILLPWVVSLSWADRSDVPNHVLTYTKGELTWDSATSIRPDGAAELNLFSAEYDGSVRAENGDRVFAPGTDEAIYVRLKNEVAGAISYTAVLYELREDERLPVVAELSGADFSPADGYTLPEGVQEEDVIRAVTGTVKGGSLQDLDVNWVWNFEESELRDGVDTTLGNLDGLPTATVGLYIVVEDGNSYVTPEIPDTGDHSYFYLYLALMLLSFLLLLILLLYRRREAKGENT